MQVDVLRANRRLDDLIRQRALSFRLAEHTSTWVLTARNRQIHGASQGPYAQIAPGQKQSIFDKPTQHH